MTTTVSREQRHTRQHRCPICDGADQDPRGKSKRCTGFTNEDAGYTHCSREEFAGGVEGKNVQGVTLFAHLLHGPCRCGVEHGPRTETRDTIEAVYPYVDEAGDLLFEVVRKAGKKFLQRKPNGVGGYEWKIGDTRRVLYRLPAILASDPELDVVWIVEGEKDVAAIERAGRIATCNPGGAGKWSLVREHAREVLRGRHVIVIADKDGEKAKFAGQKHAIEIERSLRDVALSVEIRQAPDPHKDAADMVAAGLTLDALVAFTIPVTTEPKPAATMRVVPASTLPEIKAGVDISRIADEGIAALAKSETGIYERGGRLVSVVRISEPPKYRKGIRVERAVGSPVIKTLAYPSLYERLSTAAMWLRKNKKGEFAPTVPHTHAARAIFERGEWGGIPSLVGVTVAPAFRADGTLLQEPGFDAATGLLYWPNARYPAVASSPSHEDARLAYEAICQTARCFPFAAPSHRAAWVCSLLTVLARTAIDGPVPMFIMDANTRGVGKTKLVDAVFRIVLGFGAPQTALPEQNEEIRKTITSCVLAGDQAILFDNIKRKLGGEGIEGAVTAVTWKGRRLGSDDQMSAPMRIVFFATGNNLELTSDLARRSLHIRLESSLENPEDRSDTFDLIDWIEERRHHLVAWALTMLRAWHVAGRPRVTKTMGSFEAWSDVIPQAVAWACGIDPLEARASVDVENDEERMQLNAILACIESMGTNLTAKQIVTTLFGGSERHDGTIPMDHHPTYAAAREAIEAVTFTKSGQSPSSMKLGKYLLRVKGRVVGGRKILPGPTTNNQHTWGVKKI
jgi:5S rRNA maturation endonuclease (ribonuclease M5)